MDFTISKKLNKPFDQAVELVTSELKKEGFGIITEIDLQEKFREKLDISFRPYKILGACNPALAHKAIGQEPHIGVMLPCNVLVQETESGEVEVAAVNPLNTIGNINNEKLQGLAEEVSEKLQLVLDRL